MSHTEAFDDLLAEQPADWSFFEVYVTLDDAAPALRRARLAGARQRPPGPRARPTTTSRSRSPTPTATAPRAGVRALGAADPRRPRHRRPHLGRRDAHARRGRRRRTATAPRARAVYRDEDDLQLLAELAGVLDQTVTRGRPLGRLLPGAARARRRARARTR